MDVKNAHTKFDSDKLDKKSFNLGMVYAFAEIVSSGVKHLALSPALSEQDFNEIIEDIRLIAKEFCLPTYVDQDFLETKLFNPLYTRGKIVVHLAAKDSFIEQYKALREKKKKHVEEGTLTDEAQLTIAWEFGRLLSYSNEAIEGLIKSPRF